MSAAGFDLVNLLSILSVGRRPIWTQVEQAKLDTLATNPGDGVSLALGDGSYAVLALVTAELRSTPWRTARLTVDTFDAGETYTADFGTGSPVSVATPADVAALLDGLKSAIEGDGALSQLVTVTAVDADEDTNTDALDFVLNVPGETPFQFTASGAAALALEADGYAGFVGMGLRAGGTNPPAGFRFLFGGDLGDSGQGVTERLAVAGFHELAVWCPSFAVQGPNGAGGSDGGTACTVTYRTPTVYVGVCVAE